MKKILPPAALAAALLLSSASIDALLPSPAVAQEVDFDTFHDALAPYGAWVYSDRWGEVWIPTNVPGDFRPYDTDGYWVYTDDYGWYWNSDYPWGDVAFHYGRWVNDPDDGWLWIPGYEWSPAWVMWRHNGQYVGWMAMPPDRRFLGEGDGGFNVGLNVGNGVGLSFNFGGSNDYAGYRQWYGNDYDENRFASNWVFVGTGHMADRDFHQYAAPRNTYVNIIHNTTNITNYTVVNNYVVNRSIDPRVVERASGHPVVAVRAAEVVKRPQFVMRADQGQQLQARMRQERPRGNGQANSAPKPSQAVVQSLSTNVTPHGGHGTTHLFTRQTIVNAPLPAKPVSAGPNTMGGPTGAGQSMMGPNERRHGNENAAPSNTMQGPNNANGNPESMRHRGNENTMTTPANTMQAPNNAAGNPQSMRRRGNENTTPANAMQSPTREEKSRAPIEGGPSMMGPTNTMQSPNTIAPERHVRERTAPSEMGAPSGNSMRGSVEHQTPPPQGNAPSMRGTMKAQPQTPPPPQQPSNKGDEKDKKHHPQ